tara:strand:- start:1728 stop:2633 length:906 start_codon:yes stop_codon:yes gene_type:complete
MNYKNILNNLVTISIFIFIGIYLYNNKNLIESVDFRLAYLFPILFLSISRYLINSIIDIKLLENVGLKIKFYESLNLTVVNTFGNIAGPMKIGSGLKVTYLKTKHKLSFYKYFVINTQYAILHLLGSLIILLVTVFINEDRYKNEVLVLITILISSLFLAFIFIKNFDFEKNKTKLNKYFFDLISVFNFKVIKVNKLELIFHSLTHLLFGFINLYLIFKLVGFDSMFIESVYFNLITSLSSVATITPGNIGILELIHVLFKELYSLSAGEVVFISVISRIASLISLMTLNILTKINKNTLF